MKKKDSKTKGSTGGLKVVGSGPASGRRGDAGGSSAADPTGGIDFDAVRTLARIAVEFDLAEIEASAAGHVRVRRGGTAVDAGAPPLSAQRALALGAPVETRAEGGVFISSPFVGTFYRAPSPEAAMFVEPGQSVRKGQVVCIVEAMKLMNEIEAESDGRIEEILVQNGEHVEYGQHLFRLGKS